MDQQGRAAPVADGERIATMDILRGVALLGIFLMNIEFFTRPLQSFSGGLPSGEGLDHLAGWLVYVFVQGKFWVLFSLLFGMGFALMHERAQAAGRPFAGLYLRRTVLLGLFGLGHIVLVWVGDILLAYALGALLLMAFMQVRGHWLWVLGVAMYVGMAGLWCLGGFAMSFIPESAMGPVQAEMAAIAAQGDAAAEVYKHGDFAAITAQRIDDYFGFLFTGAVLYQLPMLLGAFLVGTWLLRSGRVREAAANRGFFIKLAVSGLLVGGAFIAASLAIGTSFDPVADFAAATMAMGVMALGNLPLSLAYLSVVVLLCTLPGPARLLAVFAPAGRMALTNYLTQSLVASLLFYGYGLGWFGDVGRAAQVGLVVVVFALQLAFSHWWLARFRYGPMEWLWRAGTYLRVPAFRRDATPAHA